MQQMKGKKKKKQKKIVWASEGWKVLVEEFDIKDISNGNRLKNK